MWALPFPTRRVMTPVPLSFGLTMPPAGVRSCAMCPSAVSDSQLRNMMGKGIGGPGCAIKSIPIGLPIASQKVRDNNAKHLAKSCDKYGTTWVPDAQAADAPIEFGPVFLPIVPADAKPGKVPTCQACRFFIPPVEVAEVTGWNTAACGAKGTLLLMDRLGKYARVCNKSSPVAGVPREQAASLKSVMWFPEYTAHFGEADRAALAKKHRSVDPASWPTDRPITDEDKSRGIISWRRVDDPEGYGKPVHLPIYGEHIFSEEERAKIPRTGDDEHPEIYHDHGALVYKLGILWRRMDGTPAAWGPAGVGKTELGRHMAWLMGMPFDRISINGSSEIDDLAGSKEYSPDKGTYFNYGRLPRAWQRPGIILLDEPNVGPPDVWQFIRPLTDNSKQLVLDMAGGPTIRRHRDCYFMLAMNPAWDMRNIGTNTIGDADARRLLHLYMDLPPEPVEKEIITDWCMTTDGYDPAEHLDKIMNIAKDIREMCKAGSLPITWGIAPQIKVARLLQHYAPMVAFQIAVLNYLDPNVAQPVVDSILSHYPS